MLLLPELLPEFVATPEAAPIWILEAEPAETTQLLPTVAETVKGKLPELLP